MEEEEAPDCEPRAGARASHKSIFLALCWPIPPILDLGPNLAGQEPGVGVEQQKEV